MVAGWGSSPLARGLPAWPVGDAASGRIIPARAGFTRRRRRLSGASADHPRSRGVYSSSRRFVSSFTGSSPLARGLLLRPLAAIRTRGIIPARAGFTAPQTAPQAAGGDHPRSRGVYLYSHRLKGTRMGSSPLARGLPARRGGDRDRVGIIPARAGFTGRRPRYHGCRPDHPRSRGVYAAPS